MTDIQLYVCMLPCSRMEEGADMHSLLLTDNNTLLLGGLQNYVTEVDLNTVQETQKVRLPRTCTQYLILEIFCSSEQNAYCFILFSNLIKWTNNGHRRSAR